MLSWWLTLAMLASASAGPCQVGAYRLADATTIDIAPAPGNTLRWRRFDGATGALVPSVGGKWTSTLGWAGRPDGHEVSLGDCAEGGIAFDGVPGRRIDLAVQDTTFSDAAGVVVSSNFSNGLDAFEVARAKYRHKAWYPDLQGNVTQFLLPLTNSELRGMTHIPFPMSEEEIRERGQIYIVGTPWHYDPLPLLRQLRVPQLWLLGGEDRDAPAANTLRRLHALADAGAPITAKLFENAEHGMTVVATNADGELESVRYPAGYLRMIVDFAHDGSLMRNGDNAGNAK